MRPMPFKNLISRLVEGIITSFALCGETIYPSFFFARGSFGELDLSDDRAQSVEHMEYWRAAQTASSAFSRRGSASPMFATAAISATGFSATDPLQASSTARSAAAPSPAWIIAYL